jgi:hypothetical protein
VHRKSNDSHKIFEKIHFYGNTGGNTEESGNIWEITELISEWLDFIAPLLYIHTWKKWKVFGKMNKGTISQITVIKLFISIFENGSSGVLYLKKETIEGALKVLYFNRGKFYSAISNADVDKLDNILLANKLINELKLKEVNAEENISESKGKILVEKGIITLEQLIECTKEQFRNIVSSVLKWEEGRFQFIEEALPEGLLNLDINILNFVFNIITQQMDLQLIEKTIKGLGIKLVQNSNAEKLEKYNLNEKQKALLKRFNGELAVEDILTGYPEEHRDSILKIIYFFYVSELVIPAEVKGGTQSFLKEETDRPIYNEQKIVARPDAFVFGKKQKPDEEAPPKPTRILFSSNDKIMDDKKKSKHFNAIIVFIILIFVIGGIIFLLLMQENDQGKKLKAVPPKDIVAVEESKPKVSADDQKIVVQMKKQEEAGIPAEKKPEPKEDKKAESKPVQVKPDQTVLVKKEPGKAADKKAVQYFRNGDFLKACDIWRKEIIENKVTTSILLELDCLKESVLNAYNRIDRQELFFILKRDMGNKFCFLVFWGKFKNRDDATAALREIPPYFFSQSHPPQVIELDRYL